MKFYKLKLNSLLVQAFLLIICLQAITAFDCSANMGCVMKKKFFGYVSTINNVGEGNELESNINYKNVFVFKDKIAFYKASLPQENVAEPEITNINKKINESNIIRVIPFRHITLECGYFKTSICHAKKLPNIAKSKSFNLIKAKIANADDKCIAFSFFDEAYKDISEKIAVLCITDPRQVKDLLQFKNDLARTINKYQLLQANNRYDASGGIVFKKGHYIAFVNNKPTNVIAKIKSKAILLVTDDAKEDFVKNIELLGLRNSGVYQLREATEKKKLKEGWNDSLSIPPPPDCCIVLPSDSEINLLCIPNSGNKKEPEVKSERCSREVKDTQDIIKNSVSKIQIAEKITELITDNRISNNCKAVQYEIFKRILSDTGKISVASDCKILMQYSPDLFMTKKEYCIKNYTDSINLQIKLLALGNKHLYNDLKQCSAKDFGIDFSDNYIMTLMKKYGIDSEGGKGTSFLQISSNLKGRSASESELESEFGLKEGTEEESESQAQEEEEEGEKDDINDDDAVIEAKPKKAAAPSKKKIPLVFAEVSSKGKQAKDSAPAPAAGGDTNSKNKVDDSILYNKPKTKYEQQMLDKIAILRENSMRNLQKNHVWRPAKNERQNEAFSKTKYQQGNKNADLFVSFLGYIRDSSYKQSTPLFEKIVKKFSK